MPWVVVTAPLVLLAIPSVVIGYYLTIQPMICSATSSRTRSSSTPQQAHPAMASLAKDFHGAAAMALHGLS